MPQRTVEHDAPDFSSTPMTHPQLVYVLAASHSGSTLLAMLLGSHAETCTVGELKVTSLGDAGHYLCSCGQPIRQCTFWQQVHAGMAAQDVSFDIANAATDIRHDPTWYTGRLLRPLHRGALMERLRDAALSLSPTWHRVRAGVQRRNRLLVQIICDLYGAHMLIDSSKVGLRLKYLLRDPELDVRVVRLIRDGRAVALTYRDPHEFADAKDANLRHGGNGDGWAEHGRPIRDGAWEWRRSNEEAECLLRGVDPSRWTDVHYEELCADPDATMDRLFRFLGLDPERRIGEFRTRAAHVIGNGMRLDTDCSVQTDDRWRSILTAEDLAEFDAVAGDLNRRYGYTETPRT